MTDHKGARAPSFIRTPFRVTLQGNQNNYSTRTWECKVRPAIPSSGFLKTGSNRRS